MSQMLSLPTADDPSDPAAIRPFSSRSPTRSSRTCAAASRRRGGPTARPIPSQGVRLARSRRWPRYWATDYDWRAFEARFAALPAFRHRDRRRRHPLHPRALEARGRAAADRHPRLARLDDRAAQDHRAADGSRRPRRRRVRRLPPGHPVAAGPRLLGEADGDRLGPDPHRARLGRAHERLGYRRYVAQGGDWGNAVTEQLALLKPAGLLGIHTEHAGDRSAGRLEGARHRRPEARRAVGRRGSRVRDPQALLRDRASATRRRWATARRRSTASRTRRSAWRPG